MVDVLTEIEIHRPLQEVSDYAANPDNAPEWYVNIDSSEWLTERSLTISSQIAFKAQFQAGSFPMCMKLWSGYQDKG